MSIALPHPWEDEGELVLHLLEECSSADRVECIGKVQGDQYPVWMVSLIRLLIPCTMSSAPPHSKLHRENVSGSFFLLEVAHNGRAVVLVEDGPYGNGPYATIFLLGYGN